MYRYTGETERVYPDIIIPGEGSLVAHPGDIRELDGAPDSAWWVEEDGPAPAPSLIVEPADPANED